jgi:replicative DNA helicase
MNQVKELPHDLLAEKSLIGCLIIDGSSFDEISNLSLKQKDFFHPQYGIIFETISDLTLNHLPIDYITLCARLKDHGKLDVVGGQSAILEIVEDQAHAANVYHYGKIVKEKSALRDIVKNAMRIADQGLSFAGNTEDFIQDVEASFFKLTNDAKSGGMTKLNVCLKENLKELENTDRAVGEISGLTTGYKKLDELILGMLPGQMIILAARPAMGKTSLALNIAMNSCEATGLPVAVFSLEMLKSELSMRLLSSKAKVDSRRIKSKNFLDTDLKRLSKAIKDLGPLPFFINDNGSVTLLDIMSECRKIKSEQGLGLIVIDYLQLMKSHSNNPSREQQISEISRGIKAMAKELECPVLALSQLNRGVESRPNKRPNVSDLRESGSIEQDADIVMMIYRDEVYDPNSKEKGVAEVIVGKNRSGETGTAKLAWVGAYTSFENLAAGPNNELSQ